MTDVSNSNSANGAMLSPTATAIETQSGRYFDLAAPRGDQFAIDDIAAGLSLTCRYGGQISRFFSVAEHSVLVHNLLYSQGVRGDLLLAALFHDAAEAFLGDLVAPLKYALRQGQTNGVSTYDALTTAVDHVIADKYGIDARMFDHPRLRAADMWALKIEAAELTSTGGANWRWEGDLPNDGALPDEVRERWGLHQCAMQPEDQLLGRCDKCAARMWQVSLEPFSREILAAVHKGGFDSV